LFVFEKSLLSGASSYLLSGTKATSKRKKNNRSNQINNRAMICMSWLFTTRPAQHT